jgi:hypothetical protein
MEFDVRDGIEDFVSAMQRMESDQLLEMEPHQIVFLSIESEKFFLPADPALRWDTPPHPPAFRAEPPNSAQPFLFQVLGLMKPLTYTCDSLSTAME